MRGLFFVVLIESARLCAELEERHLALGAFPYSQRHDRGPYPGAHVNRALRVLRPTRTIQPVNVLMASELANRELVKPSDRDLTGVSVSGNRR